MMTAINNVHRVVTLIEFLFLNIFIVCYSAGQPKNYRAFLMWQIDTTKHYKIWFSKNPNEFLDRENQARFIAACRNNPQITFSFIYSGTSLSEQALQSLKDFCNQNQIKPVDFDTAILPLLKQDEDKELYQLALKEIKEKWGNLASASDCARLIVPILEQFGIYSDFDLELLFSSLPKVVRVNAPVLCPVEFMRKAMLDLPCINNELLMVSFDPEHPSKISPEALAQVRRLQAAVKACYADPQKALTTHPIPGLSLELETEVDTIIKQFFTENPNADIFAFRQFVLQLNLSDYARMQLHGKTIIKEEKGKPDWLGRYIEVLKTDSANYLCWRIRYDPDLKLSAEDILAKKLEILKHNLYVYSVMYISGPMNYFNLSDKIPPAGFKVQGNAFCSTISPASEWQCILNNFKAISIQSNGFADKIVSKNTLAHQRSQDQADPLALVAPANDLSWTPLGESIRQKRAAQACQKVQKKQKLTTPQRKNIL